MTQPLITPVLLSGGSGARLWPLSRQTLPKQFLPLTGERSMLQETAARALGEGFGASLVVCNQEHRFLIAEQMRAMAMDKPQILLEPVGRNTAPAAAVAALRAAEQDPDALLLLMPSDHVILDLPAFGDALAIACTAAEAGALVTFGVFPTSPQTGYGYIKSSASIAGAPGAFAIERFVEKPDHAAAQSYLAAGGYFWNSGMFLFRAQAFLDELDRLQPEILVCCRAALARAQSDADFIRLDAAAFAACPSVSIDYAVMEHTGLAAIVPVDMGWSDVGSWQSLWEISERDGDGNAVRGSVLTENVHNSYLRSEGPLIAAVGVEDLAVVATKDAVLVSRRAAAQDVKKIVDRLEGQGSMHVLPPEVRRPWGSYENIDQGSGFLVKRLMVKPGGKLSLQMHHHRAEYWVVVAGTALVTCGERQYPLHVGETTHIPLETRHRLENPGPEPLVLIEVQSGALLSEDDIVRFADIYGRSEQDALI